ncbi:alpha/beta fold hydrolase [Rickettsiales endosymbiont of Stachyamoeba lipophora]|uniref:alpha/beta fold hydrolase n=1 Tax=Rickettsiales endosymbiont of Stachyamoeba lipophora TaxID=2486578 RepID=UPI000F649898|nr:alpha/beta hydrolase [Rickettsiales endosymbiont of Stachyamoeba lipophora]AZL15760.1 alpha/beta hydrolase [Rickettsiales endosymbiont of Stachyamoeba lipophora]
MNKFIGNYKLNQIRADAVSSLNVLFLPGRPGMGSDYLADLVQRLTLPGNLFVADFPGDGNNLVANKVDYEPWKDGLLKLVNEFSSCILVTHSFSGMFALTITELENILAGLIIMNAAPDKSWMKELGKTAKNYNFLDESKIFEQFYSNPTNENAEKIFYSSIPYLFLPHEEQEGRELLKHCFYNAQAKLWGDTVFHPNYEYKWYPKELPTLLIGSTDDRLLPIKLFDGYEDFVRPNIQKIVFEDTGHFPWLTKFEEINDVMLDFVMSIY